MKKIKIEKLTLNMGVGESSDKLSKARKLLDTISKSKSVETKTMKRIPTWGIRPKLPIGCKVTLRRTKARGVLSKLFRAVDNKIAEKSFDDQGNFSFGIKEYLDIPSIEYDPEIGIVGLEAAVTLERPGFRVKRKRIKRGKLHHNHKITKEESKEFVKKEFNIKIISDEEKNEL